MASSLLSSPAFARFPREVVEHILHFCDLEVVCLLPEGRTGVVPLRYDAPFSHVLQYIYGSSARRVALYEHIVVNMLTPAQLIPWEVHSISVRIVKYW